ncbi:MAG: hypothetical protein ABSF22_08025 [Bryobacteraceae bacterium]
MFTLVLLFAFFLDSIPSGWITLKDQKKVCQVGAPGDFKADPSFPGLGKGPGDAVEVAVYSSTSPVKPIMESVGKMMNIEKFVENSTTRVFYQAKQLKLKDGRLSTQWTVKVPRTGGQCFATINVSPGGQDDLVKKIAATIAPAN